MDQIKVCCCAGEGPVGLTDQPGSVEARRARKSHRDQKKNYNPRLLLQEVSP